MAMLNWLRNLWERRSLSQRHTIDNLFQVNHQSNTTAGVWINEDTALSIGTAANCIKVLSEDLASLSFPVYQLSKDGRRDRAKDHAVYPLLNYSPNDEQDAFTFWETVYQFLFRFGNSYCEIERARSLKPLGLHIIRPTEVEIKRDQEHKLYYQIRGTGKVIYPQDMLHFRLMGDGMIGYSPIKMHKESLGLAKALQSFGSAYFGNSAKPGGIMKLAKTLSPKAKESLESSLYEYHGGPESFGKWMILEQGTDVQFPLIPNEDAQFLATREFQRSEIAAMYRVPPHFIGDLSRTTFNNVEQLSLDYVQNTIRPQACRIECEINKKLFTPAESKTFYAEHLLDSLLRGDVASRTQACVSQFQNGALTLDEWRALENRNPVLDPTQHFVPLQMQTLAKAISQPQPEAEAKEIGDADDSVIDREPQEINGEPAIPSDAQRSAVREVLSDSLERVIRREVKAVRKLAKKPSSFADEVGEFYSEHEAFMVEAIRPAVAAYLAICEPLADADQRSADIARCVCSANRTGLEALATEDDLDNAVFGLTTAWEMDRAREIVASLP